MYIYIHIHMYTHILGIYVYMYIYIYIYIRPSPFGGEGEPSARLFVLHPEKVPSPPSQNPMRGVRVSSPMPQAHSKILKDEQEESTEICSIIELATGRRHGQLQKFPANQIVKENHKKSK